MTNLAKWRPGVVDETWKRQVVEANRRKAIDTINGLNAILYGMISPGVGATDFEGQCNALRSLSADNIADQLLRYWRVTNSELDASANVEKTDAR